MPKYLIIDPKIAKRSPVSGQYFYCHNAIIGTIVAKSRAVTLAKAIKLTSIPRPIIAIYSSLTDSELEMAKLAPTLWTQPEGNPKTDTNPNGSGYRSRHPDKIRINLDVGLSKDGGSWYRSQPNKTAMLRNLIEAAAKSAPID